MLPGYSHEWMPYYTHNRNMDTHHMYMFLLYQVIMLDECIITHIRDIWKLTTYFVLMCYQPILMPYYTHCRNMDVHHYVCNDVLSGDSVGWMPYYTLHNMNAHHYVCTNVLSAETVGWMSYDTHYKNTGINNYVCVDVLSGYSVG